MIGAGVLKGMLVTFREFIGTYPVGRWLWRLLRVPTGNGLFTIQYPEVKQAHPERFRYFPFLVYDKTPEDLRCVSCKICEQECPPQCIFIEHAKDAQGRPLKNAYGRPYPAKFDIDMSICMSCRICVDVCPFDAIEMDNQYELSAYDRGGPLVFNKDELLKSADYFRQIKPAESAVVDQRLSAKAKKTQASASTPTSSNPHQPS